jgi:hypothetical protein
MGPDPLKRGHENKLPVHTNNRRKKTPVMELNSQKNEMRSILRKPKLE